MTVPSLCSTTEKLPEMLILIVFPVSRLVAVPTNGPDPKILPSLKMKKFETSGAVGWMRTGKLHASSVSGPCTSRSMNGFVAPSRPREDERTKCQGHERFRLDASYEGSCREGLVQPQGSEVVRFATHRSKRSHPQIARYPPRNAVNSDFSDSDGSPANIAPPSTPLRG